MCLWGRGYHCSVAVTPPHLYSIRVLTITPKKTYIPIAFRFGMKMI